jgi:hypothetical protein
VDFGRHAGALFETLQPIRLVTPDGIRKLLDVPEPMTDTGRLALDDFSHKLIARGETRFALEANSSDLLLVMVLPRIGRHVTAASLEAATEGAARVRWFAERLQELSASEENS